MANYPYSFDNNITIPGVSGSTQEDIAITALRSAVFAIEFELGITPSGIYPDVRTRLDILESRINFSVPPGFINQGYIVSPLILWNTVTGPALTISDGYGAPTENRLDGSLFMRGDGYANNQLYIRLNGSWFPVQTEQFKAANDLEGFPLGADGHLAQTVIGLYNHPLSISLNTIGATQDGYHLTWDNADGYWRAETGFLANNDLAPAAGSGTRNTGRTAQTVVGIQNKSLSSGLNSPNDGYALIWEAADGHWDQEPLAIVWHNSVALGDGYVTRTNIRSNKILQSPSTNAASLVGMINFGTSTNGSGGASANYAMILGGDRNTASGVHSITLGGFTNSATDGYSLVLNGNNNMAGAGGTVANATVINGVSNTASGIQSTVQNGNLNTAGGTNSFILNGSGNSIGITSIVGDGYSGILNGLNNSISTNSTHAGIGFGSSNQITGGTSSTYSIIAGGSSNTVSSATNAFLGAAASSSTSGNYSAILSGQGNSIATLSDYAVILSGISNVCTASSEFAHIGSGQNNTATQHFVTILNGAFNSVNGVNGQILNGTNNSATGNFVTILNGGGNTISGGADGYAMILDGYNHTITGQSSWIGDGYTNVINGQYSTILNGNTNTINGRNSTILNGANNSMDSASAETTVIVGEQNVFTNSANSTVTGSSNTFTNAAQTFVVGTLNSVQSTSSFINGTTNTLGSGTSNIRIFGGFNTVNTGSTVGFIIGNGNQLINSASNINILGANNTADGYSNMLIFGSNNYGNAASSSVEGQFGRSRFYSQAVQSSNTGFGTGRVGEAQFSRVILNGTAPTGNQFFLQTHDPNGSPANLFFLDGYSYEISIRVLVVNVQSNPATFPTVPVRFVFDVLAHQEGGVLILDDVNRTLVTQNTTLSFPVPWSVTLSASGNQLLVSVDAEGTPLSTNSVNGSGDTRRAIATVEVRELSRIT
jgi:hypothetical protein